jgi:hypothetical protein
VTAPPAAPAAPATPDTAATTGWHVDVPLIDPAEIARIATSRQ